MSLASWIPGHTYDLITCSHGLHYLGDKLKIIELVFGTLNENGLFVGNLDLNNISVAGTKPGFFLKDFFKKKSIQYNSRTKILQRKGKLYIKFPLIYAGADDNAGPNYTGQDAVTSYYTLQK